MQGGYLSELQEAAKHCGAFRRDTEGLTFENLYPNPVLREIPIQGDTTDQVV
jgi:hypothetical protein